MKNPRWIKIVALLLALSFIEPRLAFADAKEDAAQAARDIDAAYKEAQENIPNGTVKPNEDKLDEAARKNDETPDNDPGKQAAQKAEDDARSKADDTNAPFKANGDKRGDKYREALKKRREACKRLKKALADLRQQLQKRRQSMAVDTSDLEKAIRDAEKARKEQEKTPERPTVSMAVPQGTPTLATLLASGKIKIDSVGTGETIGHVADLKIANLTHQPINCAVGPMVLESISRKNQDYVCPAPQTVTINPHSTAAVPVNGVCINRNKPPVGKGALGDLIVNTGDPSVPVNPDSHVPVNQAGDLLRICTSKYDAADQLQKSGALKNLPYHDPQKQKDIVVQWSTWCDPRISEITGSPPATKDDLKKVVYKQLESKKLMSPETKKKVDQGIDTIFEKIELTTAKAKDLEKPEEEGSGGSTTEEGSSLGQPVYVSQTRAKQPTATPKSKGGGKTTSKPTPTPKPTPSPTPTPSGGGETQEKETPTEEKPKTPPPVPSYPYTKEIDCGTITISIGDSGELVFDFKRNDKKCPCKEFGWIQHISPADQDNWRYDNGVLPGVSTPKKQGAKSDPSKPKQPTTPPKGTKLEDWDKNPWYGGTTDKSKPKDFGEHPTPQTHISDKPDAPNVKFITQLVCVETGEVLFSWEWGPFEKGTESPDKVGGGETEPPPNKK